MAPGTVDWPFHLYDLIVMPPGLHEVSYVSFTQPGHCIWFAEPSLLHKGVGCMERREGGAWPPIHGSPAC